MKNIMIKQEMAAILKNRKLLIPIIAVMFIPVLYAGMFLWAFWDPYAKLADLPVAVVNSDTGAEFNGEDLQLGNDLVDKLKDSKEFDFELVGKEQGYKQLKNQKYYMLIEIPADFSENATTLLDENPEKLKLIYVPNESYNFLSAQIGGTAVDKIKASLSEKVTETYAETMFDKIGDLADGVKKASEGAGQVSDGSSELQAGSAQLNDGLKTLAGKAVEFSEGANKLNAGAAKVSEGNKQLASGMAELQGGHQKITAGAEQVKAGADQLASGAARSREGLEMLKGKLPAMMEGTDKLQQGANALNAKTGEWQKGSQAAASGAASLNAGIDELVQGLQPMLASLPEQQRKVYEEKLAALKAGSSQLAVATGQLSDGAGKIQAGTSTLAGGLADLKNGEVQASQGVDALAKGSSELEAGAKKLSEGQGQVVSGLKTYEAEFAKAKAGADELAAGSSELSGGTSQLAAGTGALKTGTGKLADGSEQLAKGTSELAAGSKELADKLSDGANEASGVKADDKTYNMMADPVKVKNEKINEVPNYGTGFAPYFLSLGLFVGALLLSIVFPLREAAGTPRNGLSWFLGKFGILAGIGVVQALLADAILLGALGIHVESIPLFILFSIVTSLTFITLIQVLVTTLGDPGRFLAIIILILQLTTSAGTFPLELIPGFLQHFNAFLPMTYSVAGFKAVISSGDFAFMTQNMLVLIGFSVVFALGTLGYFITMHKKKYAILAN
ncbi:YhgE/Pip domain-containing protein [Bacillus sp. B-jedd]|uniref:YhgE/Pip domain-containing protein n=1 Tax=Bacillus sp. B-jedd TaxID=1476857 RepID=UPI0005155F8F|nr:YhgE/Pip domain-containing protein [Bacillus sp. B-jedd]CEG29621.1 ABC-2 type transporter [Bacillus sp. B-jedd]